MEYVKIAEKDGLIVLRDCNGNKATFDFLEMTVVDGTEYAALLEVDADEFVILEIVEDKNGVERYRMIDDDNVFDKVAVVFETLFEEE